MNLFRTQQTHAKTNTECHQVLDDQERRWSAKMAETLEEQERKSGATLFAAENIVNNIESELQEKSQELSALQAEHERLRLRIEAEEENEDINNANVINDSSRELLQEQGE